MHITFIRHATAQDRGLDIPDAERVLIKKGHKQVERLADYCQRNRLLPTALYCSPLKRAQQTAEQLSQCLPHCPAPETVDWLAMEMPTAHLLSALQQLDEQGVDAIWLVGHEPSFSEAIASVLATDSSCLCLKKASMTAVTVDFSSPITGQLLWSLPCSLMR